MSKPLKIEWQNRFDALAPQALLAFGAAARIVREKLLRLDDAKLSALQGVFADNLLFIAGAAEDLPWADGVIYLGRDAGATAILMPTNLRPSISVDLFEKIILRNFAAQKPFAVVGNKIIPVGKMRPISRNLVNSEALIVSRK